jgi:hypothetical protein
MLAGWDQKNGGLAPVSGQKDNGGEWLISWAEMKRLHPDLPAPPDLEDTLGDPDVCYHQKKACKHGQSCWSGLRCYHNQAGVLRKINPKTYDLFCFAFCTSFFLLGRPNMARQVSFSPALPIRAPKVHPPCQFSSGFDVQGLCVLGGFDTPWADRRCKWHYNVTPEMLGQYTKNTGLLSPCPEDKDRSRKQLTRLLRCDLGHLRRTVPAPKDPSGASADNPVVVD